MKENQPRSWRGIGSGIVTALLLAQAATASAEEAAPGGAPPPAAEVKEPAAAPITPPPPYSLPWQLRPVRPATVLRLDNVIAGSEDAMGVSSVTDVTTLTVSYKLNKHLFPMARVGFVVNSPEEGATQTSVTNILVGAGYSIPFGNGFVVTPFLGVTLPTGMGGGNDPNVDAASANRAGIWARSCMDNALFAVNDLAIIPGIGVAYIKNKLTAQFEATLLQLQRVRGDEVQPDSSKTNLTTALHVGYFVIPMLSMGAELRYQRFLSTPAAIEADTTDTLRDTLSMGIGVRGHFKIGQKMWIRPGIAYSRGLDDPMSARSYDIIQIDVPVTF